MSLTLSDVEKIANLARLELTGAEKDQFQEQLSAVLDYIAQISELELAEVPPTTHAVARHNVLRPDEVEPSLTPEEALFNAPEQSGQQFKVQAILDE